ncbi:MAG TPA: AAA domain-containing protein, partial [Myxococcota bacterium]|nr:AAA domain-containing protein [Myxococcota bacterium]
LMEDKEAVAGLTLVGQFGQSPTGIPIHRYSFPRQECALKPGDSVGTPEKTIGKVVAIERANCTIDIQKKKATKDDHPYAFYSDDQINDGKLRDALAAVAEAYLDGAHSAGMKLLRRLPPNVSLERRSDESATELAVRAVHNLDADVLPIQGPPGAGKTFTAAKMIASLVERKKRVGVTSNSHKAIRNLLRAVRRADPNVRVAHCCKEDDAGDGVEVFHHTEKGRDALRTRKVDVLGGTTWAWAGQTDLVDVLFVDEAGQMALANVLASAAACTSLVLLGDPQQLEQPTRAAHPEGTAVSALEHLFASERVVPADRGIFLDKTYRLAPEICEFTSEMFYESALGTAADLQALGDCGPFDGSGLWLVPCEHEGNKSSSDEEVEVVHKLVEHLSRGAWTHGPLSKSDIMIIAPYNAQVSRLKERLPGYEVGTVDLFQGREAAVVIFSMATSSAADAPKGMDFLFSGNRLNVATSRARAACIMVANPSLFVADCKTPEQIKLVNAFCRYRERARVVLPSQLNPT